jgi:hypothetical protein
LCSQLKLLLCILKLNQIKINLKEDNIVITI